MNIAIFSWPRSAYITIFALVVVFGFSLHWVYTETRDAYRYVGFNDGQITQKEQTLNRLQKSVIIHDCREYKTTKKPIEFLSVKADSIFLIITEGNVVQFCR
jgi:hypothetical protein